MSHRKLGFLSLYFLAALLVFGFVLAPQIKAAEPSSVGVNIAPPNPAPFENTTITLNSYSNNLDSVLITWFVNEKNTLSGIGRKSFSLTAPAAGEEATVRARIDLPEGAIEIRVVIRPNSMVLLWQANDSYVPPFYKGKAMPTADTEIKVVAMPEIKNVSPKNMVYTWKRDYTADQGASGYGKNSYIYVNDYLENSSTVSVIASTIEGASSESSINIGAVEPKISFYKKDNDFGIVWEKALENGHQVVGEEVLVAVPYFLSPKNLLHPSLMWSWFINNSLIAVQGGRKDFLPLKIEAGTSGTSLIRLQIENRDRIFQTANKEISVGF